MAVQKKKDQTRLLVVALSSFAIYVALGHTLDAQTAFTALALFNTLRTRETELTPCDFWGVSGLLGISIRFEEARHRADAPALLLRGDARERDIAPAPHEKDTRPESVPIGLLIPQGTGYSPVSGRRPDEK